MLQELPKEITRDEMIKNLDKISKSLYHKLFKELKEVKNNNDDNIDLLVEFYKSDIIENNKAKYGKIKNFEDWVYYRIQKLMEYRFSL